MDKQATDKEEGVGADEQVRAAARFLGGMLMQLSKQDLRKAGRHIKRWADQVASVVSHPGGLAALLAIAGGYLLAKRLTERESFDRAQGCQGCDRLGQLPKRPVDEVIEQMAAGGLAVYSKPLVSLARIIEAAASGYGESISAAALMRLDGHELETIARWAALAHVTRDELPPKLLDAYTRLVVDGHREPTLRRAIDKLTITPSRSHRRRGRLLNLAELVISSGTGVISVAQQAELVQTLVCGLVAPAQLLRLDKADRDRVVRLAAYSRLLADGLDDEQMQEYRDLAEQVDAEKVLAAVD